MAEAGKTFFSIGNITINITTDKLEVSPELAKEVGKTVTTLGALYFGYKLLRPVIKAAVKKALGGERDGQGDPDIRKGSLHIRLQCFTDERFLEVLAEYESGKIKERFQEEFLQVGIKVEGLKVEIENMVEVNKTKEAINKRSISESVEYTDEDDVQHNKNTLHKAIMKPLPRSKRELLEEATSLGFFGPTPSLEKPRAKLLKCIYSSMKIKRSFNHVSFLLLGKTGVGKSATVNHLLGVDLARTSKTESQTRSTKEFVVHGSDPKYEVEGLSLGLIDTPGFSDTDGSMQDVCNFLSIQKFFRTHPTLSGCYPNLVFLVAILTHACSIRKKTNEEWTKELDEIKSRFSEIMFDALKVLAPVILIENKYEDCGLERRGDYTLLPNGELQPKNLYLACADVLNNDSLGLITLNRIFVESAKYHYRITPGHEFKAKHANRCALDNEEKAMVKLFQLASEGGFRDPFYTVILQYINEQKLNDHEVEEVMKIAGVLRQIGEGNPPNFGSHSLSSIEYFLGKEISPTGRQMLQEKFKIATNPPCKLSESGPVVGRGYNILTDKSVAEVMKFNDEIKYGIAIPVCAKFEKVQQSKSFMEVFEDDQSYIQSRLKSLNVSLAIKPDMLKMDCRAGYSKKKDSTTSSSTSEYSFLFEQRMFELKIGNYKEHLDHGITFTEDFKSDVAELPSKYNKKNHSCANKFREFSIVSVIFSYLRRMVEDQLK